MTGGVAPHSPTLVAMCHPTPYTLPGSAPTTEPQEIETESLANLAPEIEVFGQTHKNQRLGKLEKLFGELSHLMHTLHPIPSHL